MGKGKLVSGQRDALSVGKQIISVASRVSMCAFQINPTTANQQFCDRGNQYRSAIFAANKGQMELAEKSLQSYEQSGKFGERCRNTLLMCGTCSRR